MNDHITDKDRRIDLPPLELRVAERPWSDTTPTVYTTVHIIAQAPTITFYRSTYPTVAIRELGGTDAIANVRLTLTGDEAQRAAFTAALRDVADAIDGWTK